MPFELPEPDPAILEHQRRLLEADADLQMLNRTQMLHWAAILCSCRPWRRLSSQNGDNDAHPDEPPQHGCRVHGTITVTFDGRVL